MVSLSNVVVFLSNVHGELSNVMVSLSNPYTDYLTFCEQSTCNSRKATCKLQEASSKEHASGENGLRLIHLMLCRTYGAQPQSLK